MSVETKQFNYINKLKEKLKDNKFSPLNVIIFIGLIGSLIYLALLVYKHYKQYKVNLYLEPDTNRIDDGNFKLIYQIDPSSTYEHPFDTEDNLSRFFEEHLYNTKAVTDISRDDIHITQEPVRLEVLPDGNEIYETHFKIDQTMSYTDFIDQTMSYTDFIEPFTLNPTDWCDEVSLNSTIERHNLRATAGAVDRPGTNILQGRVIQCSQEFDQARNVGDEYIHPTDPEIMSGYHNLIQYISDNSDLELDPEDFDRTIELVNTAITNGNIPNNGCGNYYSGRAQIDHGPQGGSTYMVTGCNKDCRQFDPAELPWFNSHGIDTSYGGSVSYDSVGINIGCINGYSSTGDITLTCNTASPDGNYSVNFGSTVPEQACKQNCNPMAEQLDKYLISSNVLNIASSSPMPLSINSIQGDYTIQCGRNYSSYPSGVNPTIELCTEGGGDYRLSGCAKDSLKPDTKLLRGYKIRGRSNAERKISASDIETLSAEDLGLSCNISGTEKYHGRPKLLGAHQDIVSDNRDYYYPYGCYDHNNCSTDGTTCIQTSFFFKFDDLSKYNPTGGGQDDIVVKAAQSDAEAILDITDLENIIKDMYTSKGNQDVNEFTVNIVKTKWIDDTYGHEIIYTVTCDAGDPCNLTTHVTLTFPQGDTLLLHEEEFNEIVDSGNRTINPTEVTDIELYKLPENLPSATACDFGTLVQSEIGLSLKGIFELNCPPQASRRQPEKVVDIPPPPPSGGG